MSSQSTSISSQSISNDKNDHPDIVLPVNQAKTKLNRDHGEINLLTKEGIDKVCKDRSLTWCTEKDGLENCLCAIADSLTKHELTAALYTHASMSGIAVESINYDVHRSKKTLCTTFFDQVMSKFPDEPPQEKGRC